MKMNLLVLVLLFLLFLLFLGPAHGHSWYDHECCHDRDCAPVTKIEQSNGLDVMTTKHGTFVIHPDPTIKRKVSKDDKFHLCVLKTQDDYKILCIYSPALY